ncbi:MAG: hypothetical protein ACO1RT_09840 [Planctomycetaceae bacterium]
MSSRSRRYAFRVLAIAIGLLPIVLAEIGLRIAGIGANAADRSLSAVDTDPLVDLHSLRPLFVPSADGTRMEIGQERMNYFCPASFPAKKAANTFRVFALGGSTTQGQPYRTETAFPQWLALRLEAAMPDRSIEVVNGGGISYASYRVAAILDEVLGYSPDLIVLYTGHNEFLEARTYARQRKVPRWLAAPLAAIARLRVAHVLALAFQTDDAPAASKTTMPSEVDAVLDRADGMEAYVRDPHWVDAIHGHFEQTLDSMVTRCQRAQVPLVICVPAGDLVNTPPFKSQPDPALPPPKREDVVRLTQIATSESAEVAARLEAAANILKIDPQHAMANYVLGRRHYESAIGDVATARQHLIKARDHDVCPLRATTRIEQAVRSQRRRDNVFLIDTVLLLDQRNAKNQRIPDDIADPAWFVDHVHPTIEGHQEIATAIYGALAGRLFTPVDGAQDIYAEKVATHLATLGEEYYGRAKQRLDGVNRWSRRFAP